MEAIRNPRNLSAYELVVAPLLRLLQTLNISGIHLYVFVISADFLIIM